MRSAFEMFEAVSPTYDSLTINKRTSLLISSAGLTAYGIKAHRGVNAAVLSEGRYLYQAFDVDALLPEDEFGKLRQTANKIEGVYVGGTRIDVPAQNPDLLPFSAILYTDEMREGIFSDGTQPEIIDDISVLPAHKIARHKNERNEPRDTIGLVLGHKDAYYDGLPLVSETRWLKEMQLALRRARRLTKIPREEVLQIAEDFAFPDDFTAAIEDGFQDEAFVI